MLKYKIPQIVTLTRIHLPQIVLKKRILIANYLTIRILFGAANGIRTRDPQLGKLMVAGSSPVSRSRGPFRRTFFVRQDYII